MTVGGHDAAVTAALMDRPGGRAESGTITVRVKADPTPPTRAEIERVRLRALADVSDDDIDYSDIPARDPDLGPIRAAIHREMGRRMIGGADLWRLASRFNASLSKSQVYEYLGGRRQLGAKGVEALVRALGLKLVPGDTGG